MVAIAECTDWASSRLGLHSAYGPQAAAHSTWQKEHAGRNDLFEISGRKLRRITRPVRLYYCSTGICDQPLKGKYQQKNVVDFPKERDEVRNDVDRKKYVRDRAGDNELVHRIHTTVSDQSVEESQKVRDLADSAHHCALRTGARCARNFDIRRHRPCPPAARGCAASLRCGHVALSPSVCGSLLPSSCGPPRGISCGVSGCAFSGALLEAAPIKPVATDLPAWATSEIAPTALFMMFIVPEIAL